MTTHPLATLDTLAATTDLLAHQATAVRASADLVDRIRPADLRRPTPCADWTLHGLLTHMIAQHRGFAAAAHGEGDPAVWKPRPLGPDPAAEYRAAAELVLAAFAEPGVPDRQFPMPEFGPGVLIPGTHALCFHLVDYVVHAWDVARTLDLPLRFEPDLLDAARTVAAIVPGGEARLAPGAPFGPEIPWTGDDPLDRLVAALGRTPGRG